MKIRNVLLEKYIDMLKNPDFEQNKCSITSIRIFKNADDSVRLMKLICYYDRSYYGNIKYYDMMGSVCKYLNETSQRWKSRRSKRSSI